jgi:hypothetical protein
MIRFLPILLFIFFVFPSKSVFAHGGESHLDKAINAAKAQSLPEDFQPAENARVFAWRLLEHGQYLFPDNIRRELFSSPTRRDVRLAHDLLAMADSYDAQSKPDANHLRFAGQSKLIALMESVEETIRIDSSSPPAAIDLAPIHNVTLRGDSGIAFVRVDGGGESPWFHPYPFYQTALNLRPLAEPDPPVALEYRPGMTSWVMIRVKEAPRDPAIVQFALKPQGKGPQIPLYIRFSSEGTGTFSCRVEDEKGDATPALMRLTHLPTGTIHRPSSAIEFTPQMEAISGDPVPSAGRPDPGIDEPHPIWMPGAWGGNYWCVGEPFTMSLAVGEWCVHAWKGPEFIPIVKEFEIRAGETTKETILLERWINLPEVGWHSGDDHVHSRLMSDADAERLLTYLEASDIRVANVVKMGNPMRTFFEQRGFGPDARVQRGGFALVPGQEDPRYYNGHALGLNIRWMARDEKHYLHNDWVADEVRRAGGLYGHAHFLRNVFNIRRDSTLLTIQGKSDFAEIMQSGILDTSMIYDVWDLGFPLTPAAGSDVPFGHAMGEVRYYVYTGEPELDVDTWFEGMKQGRSFVTNGPLLELTVNGKRPGARIDLESPGTFTINAVAQTCPDDDAGLKALRVVAHGDAIGERKVSDKATNKLELTLDYEISDGVWIAASAENHDGTKAHTAPIYITLQGGKFWNPARVPFLIDQALVELDQMNDEL